MYLPKFGYFAPTTVSEACALLSEHGGRAALMAGGTDLVLSMKQKVKTPEYVVALRAISGLDYIKAEADETKIGSLTSIRSLEKSDLINARFPMLAQAARAIASPSLRNVGTIGGNICLDTRCCYYNKSEDFRDSIGYCLKRGGEVCRVTEKGKKCLAVSQGDTVPALIALGARVTVQSDGERRTVPVEGLFRGDGRDYLALQPEELVTEVILPNPRSHSGGSFQKARARKATDFASASAAVSVVLREGICEDVRIVLGSVGTSPIRVLDGEEAIRGKRITGDLLEEIGLYAEKAAKPVANILSVSPSYRRELAGALVIEATEEAVSRAR